jgi:hypothetical protein
VPNTPRLSWPYPTEEQDPWYAPFQDFAAAADASVFAAMEDRNVFLMGGGTFAFNASTGTVSWTAAIELSSPVTGFRHTVAAASVVVADGSMLYVELSRSLTDNAVLTAAASPSLPPGGDHESFYALCLRRGSRLYFRNGATLEDGSSHPLASERSAIEVQDVLSSGTRATLGNGVRYWPLVEGASDTLQFQVRVARGGVYALRIGYYMSSSHAGAVSLRVDKLVCSDAGDPTAALTLGAGFTVTPGSNTTRHTVDETSSTSLLTSSLPEGALLVAKITRVADGADTHTGDARVLGLTLVPVEA